MKYLLSAAVLAAVMSGAALAKKDEAPEPPQAPTQQEASTIIAYAREIRETKGCAAAAPNYRVVAAMGDGFDAAQHELGECLLTMTGVNETETALFREEATFWLKRAAFAGNARAQRSLSYMYGAGNSANPSVKDALKWALVYQGNGDSDVYGFKELPATYIPGLRHDLSPEDVAAAETFAASFAAIHMTVYRAPPRPKEKGNRERLEGPLGAEPGKKPQQ